MSERKAFIDICIVSWRTRDYLRVCLRSVVGRPEVGRVIVVDNASGDGTVEMVREEFPAVKLISNERNVGYAAGNNQAFAEVSAQYALLLNPDTEVRPEALGILSEVLENDRRVGAAAPQLRFLDGRVQSSCRSFPEPAAVLFDALGLGRLFPKSKLFGRYRMSYWAHDTRREVDQPMASALLLRRAALEEVGVFDEGFPLYFNDVDLCYRLKEAGWSIVFEPSAVVIHHHGGSTRQVRAAAILESHRSLVRFYQKHYRGKVSWLGYWLVIFGTKSVMYPRAGWAALRTRE